MITDISPYIVYEMASLKGGHVQLCKYQFNGQGDNEGFAIVSDVYSFFVRIKSNIVDDKYEVNFLIIKAFQNIELDDSFTFTPVFEGELKDLKILKSSARGMVVRQKVIQDIVTENALLADFEGDKRFLIYPHKGIFTPTGLTTDTDEILDKMSEKRYSVSREVEKDINLLLRAQ
mgnify:FL=1